MRNLVVIVADTLRRLESVRHFEVERDAPFLGQIAKESFRFENAVASSSWTLPSHWSLLYGANPWRVGLAPAPFSSSGQSMSLAQAWREAGGVSVGFSQNETVSNRSFLLQDYDHSLTSWPLGALRTATEVSSFLDLAVGLTARRLNQSIWGPTPYAKTAGHRMATICYNGFLGSAIGVSTLLLGLRTSDSSLRRFAKILKALGTSRPVHVFINLMHAHEPYVGVPESLWPRPGTGVVPTNNLAIHSKNLQGDATCIDSLHASYRRAVGTLDRSLKDIFDLLSRRGLLEDALVCIVSDHGQSLGENGFVGHGWTVADELVRIPAYFWYSRPEPAQAGERRILDWVDHRHLHDMLIDQVANPGNAPTTSVKAALAKHGPAVSYFRGRSVQGFNPTRRSPEFERIRLWRGDSELEMSKGAAASKADLVSGRGGDAFELEFLAEHIFHESEMGAGGSINAVDSSRVSSRLERWGYG